MKRKLSFGSKLSRQWTIACLVFVSCFCVLLQYNNVPTRSTEHVTTDLRRQQFLAGEPIYRSSSGYIFRTKQETNIRHLDMQDRTPTSKIHFHDSPRIILLDDQPLQLPSLSRSVVPMESMETDYIAIDPMHYIKPYERPYFEECTPMADWQLTHHPTCNLLHELDTDHVALLSLAGSWRSVWKAAGEAVLKMLHLHRLFDQESFGYHQVDARMMEQLTRSPFVVDMYGFCGQSIVTEWAPQDGRALIKNTSLTTRDRLVLARDLARGLNHIHSLDYEHGTNATFSHNDINIANIVNTRDNIIKYNDFNIGAMLRWNKSMPCGYPVRFEGKLWRSPEEIENVTYVSEKTDIYALGNVLFQVMTKHQPWTWLEPEGKLPWDEVGRKKLAGIMPFVPSKYVQSKELAYQGLYFGTMSCYVVDPTQRVTAHQLAEGLNQVLEWHDDRTKRKKITIKDVAELFEVRKRARKKAYIIG